MCSLAVLVPLVMTVCGTRVCTAVGGVSGIYVDVSRILEAQSGPVHARLCVEATCKSTSSPNGRSVDFINVDDPSLDDEGPVHVVLTIETESGDPIFTNEADVALGRTQPNGPNCEPTFYAASLVATPDAGLEPEG